MKQLLNKAVGLSLLLLCPLSQAQPKAAPAAVSVQQAYAADSVAETWVPGTVISLNDASISSEISGRLLWLVNVGEMLEKNQLIARVDDGLLQLDLRSNKAKRSRLNTQLKFAESRLRRLQSLAADHNTAKDQLDVAKSVAELLVHDLESNQIAADQIARRLAQTRINAPFAGQIVSRLAQPGEYLAVGQNLVRLVDTQNREISASVPLNIADRLVVGRVVNLSIGAQFAKSKLRAVIPVGNMQSRMIEIRAELSQTDWAIGAAVRVAVPIGDQRDIVAIPRDALVLRGNQTYVYRINSNQKAERVDVETGAAVGSDVEAVGDINAGDQLVVRGAERLKPGQAVTITDARTVQSQDKPETSG